MRRFVYLVFMLLALSVSASCIDRPECVLDESQLIDVLVDVHRAEGLLEIQQQHGSHPDETDLYQKEVIAAVLQKHGVSRVQYDSTLMWYAQNLKLLTRVYGHVDERLREEHEMWSLQMTEQRDFALSEAGDSVQLWSLRQHLVLDRTLLSDLRFWEYPSDSNFVDGDTLLWHFAVRHLLPGQTLLASIALTEVIDQGKDNRRPEKKEPKDQPLGRSQQVITTDGSYTLSAVADSLQPFRSAILSLVLLQDSTRISPVFVDSLSLLRIHQVNDEQ